MGVSVIQSPAPTKPQTSTKPRRTAKPAAKTTAAKRPKRNPLEALGLDDPRQALLCAPSEYLNCREFRGSIHSLHDEESALFKLKLTGVIRGFVGKDVAWTTHQKTPRSANAPVYTRITDVPRNLVARVNRVEADVMDEAGNVAIISTFGSGAWSWMGARPNDCMHVIGSVKRFGQLNFFSIEERIPDHAIGKIWTRYSNLASLVKAQRIEMLVASAKFDDSSWRHCASRIVGECGFTEMEILQKTETPFPDLISLLKKLHNPSTMEEGHLAIECARRISALAMQASALRQTSRAAHPRSPIAIDPALVEKLKSSQKEALTADQQNVIQQVCDAMAHPKALNGLLSGDVGTGKTLAYLIPAVAAHNAGAQVAIMAPTQLLADQLYSQLVTRFGNVIRGSQRVVAGKSINDPTYILVGTSGLVTAAGKSGWIPNLLICDEQHKMSNDTREKMVGAWTHVLNVSATPIPRSLATALYDGMQILNLRQSPVKKTIHSHVTDMQQKSAIVRTIKAAIAKGERCAIVYPAVKVAQTADSEDESIKEDEVTHTVESAFEGFDKAFPGKVVMVHGQMDTDAIRHNIDRMRKGDAQLMIASTVIETGIDIPSVSVMLVRNADCFGISQLHQLRGRLVRNGGNGDFIMAVEDLTAITPDTLDRLNAVASTTDGYELAEHDLLQRGMGDFTGSAQSGASPTVFKLIKLDVTDFMARKLKAVIQEARQNIKEHTTPVQSEPVEGQGDLF